MCLLRAVGLAGPQHSARHLERVVLRVLLSPPRMRHPLNAVAVVRVLQARGSERLAAVLAQPDRGIQIEGLQVVDERCGHDAGAFESEGGVGRPCGMVEPHREDTIEILLVGGAPFSVGQAVGATSWARAEGRHEAPSHRASMPPGEPPPRTRAHKTFPRAEGSCSSLARP